MKNPVLLTFTLRDFIISFVMVVFMIALTIVHESIKGWRYILLESVLGILTAAIMIFTDSKLEKK